MLRRRGQSNSMILDDIWALLIVEYEGEKITDELSCESDIGMGTLCDVVRLWYNTPREFTSHELVTPETGTI